MYLKPHDVILFIGDSITDAGRNRADAGDLGHGYPLLVAAELARRYPDHRLSFYNRGISGNKMADLAKRWQKDCLALQPTVVSVLIGINDTWHNVGSSTFGSAESLAEFERQYRDCLQQLTQNPQLRLVLLEPFVLPDPADRQEWRTDLDPRIQAVRRLAAEFHAEVIPLDGILNAYGIRHGFSYLTGADGVHPTTAGHGLIANEWLKIVE